MTIPALADNISPAHLIELFSAKSGGIGCVEYYVDFRPPHRECLDRDVFTTFYFIDRAPIFEERERVITPFTTLVFGEIKYGPAKTGPDWFVYLQKPDWSKQGWDADIFAPAYERQVATLEEVKDSIRASDLRVGQPTVVRSWTDEDLIQVKIQADTQYVTRDRKGIFGGDKWVDADMPLRIAHTVVFWCSLHTSLDNSGQKTARDYSIRARSIQRVYPSASSDDDV
ncbi:hypothetical protein C8R44DRAFT_874500 [Mycena epipterygia]|nr:hypothetical protein C8R44DRAFT_874500 [Mycena epipterygia]